MKFLILLIVACTYRHPSMNPTELIDIYLSELLQKLSREDKTIMLMSDFNIDLLKYDTNKDSTMFLDIMYTNFLLPYITIPTRVTTHSKTLIDNTFSDNIEDGLISGNIITTISDHYAQFLLQKNIKIEKKEKNIFRHNFKNFNEDLFDYKLNQINWNAILEIDKKDIDTSFNNFFLIFNSLLQQHAPIKNLSNKEIKTLRKPWITSGILKSINKKNKIHRKSARTKNVVKKEDFNEFFCDIPKRIEKKKRETRRKYQHYLLNPVVNTFHLDPANPEEVQSYIKTLKNNKSTGPSSIPNKLLRQFKKPLSEPLTLRINLTFTEGKFPAILKMGKFFPVHKKRI